MKRFLLLLSLIAAYTTQAQEYTLADSLRGTLSSLRSCYDVTYYNLNLKIDIENKSISGYNDIYFKANTEFSEFQIDLFENMKISSIEFGGIDLEYTREFNAVFVELPEPIKYGTLAKIRVNYSGTPPSAKNAPWDGGFVWKKDENGKDWVGVACEGMGASMWWPNKDHLSDEPDSMTMTFTVPSDLKCIANGKLREEKRISNKETRYTWHVSYPINNYNVTLNIADYTYFSDTYTAEDGSELALGYYVLHYNLEKAKKQFEQVKPMMKCYEAAFGKYPFWNDGYKLVETSYLGMEHQSAIAYGNKYKPGYLGSYPGNIDFDYIIIHETGHEWWGNSVSMNDLADMWIHESFCTYGEALYVEYMMGKDKMMEYINSQRKYITNGSPIVGDFGVNKEGNGTDMYYKGAWMLHTLRSVMDNDDFFKSIIKGIATDYARTNVDGTTITEYISEKTGQDYSWFFDEYLRHASIPVFEYKYTSGLFGGGKFSYHWQANNPGFKMPVKTTFGDGNEQLLKPTAEWQTMPLKKKEFRKFKISLQHYLINLRKIG